MGLIDIKKELKKLDKEKLIDLVADLYKKNKSVKEFFDFYVNPNETELFDKYRKKVFIRLESFNFIISKILNKKLVQSKWFQLSAAFSFLLYLV